MMKIVLIMFISFFFLSVVSASGCINWFKDFAKNCQAKNRERVRDSLFAVGFAMFFAPIMQLAVAFIVKNVFGVAFVIPGFVIIFWLLLFLAAEQFYYEWGIQLLIKALVPKIINGILKKFGLLKEENNGADNANTDGNN